MKKGIRWAVMICMLLLALFLYGLSHQDRRIHHPFNQSIPDQPVKILQIQGENIDQAGAVRSLKSLLLGHISLLHVWATWCPSCQHEHEDWMRRISTLPSSVKLMGVMFQGQSDEGRRWLKRYGNPYHCVIDDASGQLGLSLGMTGTPELYLIDQKGRVLQKWVGPLNDQAWQKALMRMHALGK